MNFSDPSVYTPVYTADEIGAPMTLREELRPAQSIYQTTTAKVLIAWRENFGLSMTAHLLCHVMQRPWEDIRNELTSEFSDGFFRVVDCPDIKDIAYYIDYPYIIMDDPGNKVSRYMLNVKISDRAIHNYPPEHGYINSWEGEGLKEYKFRERAHFRKYSNIDRLTNEEIIETLRAACV